MKLTVERIEKQKTVKQMAEMLGDVYDTWNCNRYKALYYFIKEDYYGCRFCYAR